MGRQAGSAYIDFTARTTGVTTGMEQARAATRKAAREMKADIHEAQGSIALLGEEIGVKLPRHLRSFVAELPGVATALSSAFSGVAIVGLGMIAVEQAKKIYEAFEKMRELPKQIDEGFEALTGTLKAQNDELRLSNIELQNAINKFKGVPENRLAEGLAAATVEAGKLAAELNKADDAVQKLFKENQVSIWAKIFEGMAGTGDVQKDIDKFRTDIKKTTDDALEKLRKDRDTQKPKDFNATLGATKTTVNTQYTNELADLNKQLADAQKQQEQFSSHWTHGARDMTAVIKVLQGSIAALGTEQDNAGQLFENMTLKEEKFGETGMSAAERNRKALEEFRQQLSRDSEEFQHGIKFQQELTDSLTETWLASARIDAEAERQKEEASKKATAQFIADRKAQQEIATQAEKTTRDDASESYQLFAQQSADRVAMGQETDAQRLADLQARLVAEEQASQDSYVRELNLYQDNQVKQSEILREAAKERYEIEHELNVFLQQDRANSLQGMFDDMIKRANDSVAAIKGIFTSLTDGINNQLVNLMSGRRTDFKNMFSGVAGQVAKAGLQTAEGKLLGTFGGMKRDGSSPQAALYTITADDVKKTGTDILGAAKGSPDPATANDTGGLFSQGAGQIFGDLISAFIPHASGGPVAPGSAYLVGERGPEPFFPGVSGTIGTNAAMQRAFGSTTTHGPTYVDARGSSDPAAVNAAVHRAMRAYAPSMITASAAFQQDMKRRVPATANL
jgi:hypothetical protein